MLDNANEAFPATSLRLENPGVQPRRRPAGRAATLVAGIFTPARNRLGAVGSRLRRKALLASRLHAVWLDGVTPTQTR